MVSQLFHQLGVDARRVISSRTALVEDERRPCGVFHVEEALDHPAIPAQADFVIPYAIRSAIGFGGILPAGEMFAVVAFSRARIPEHAVDAFVAAALGTKLALSPFSGGLILDVHHAEPSRTDLALVVHNGSTSSLRACARSRFPSARRSRGERSRPTPGGLR